MSLDRRIIGLTDGRTDRPNHFNLLLLFLLLLLLRAHCFCCCNACVWHARSLSRTGQTITHRRNFSSDSHLQANIITQMSKIMFHPRVSSLYYCSLCVHIFFFAALLHHSPSPSKRQSVKKHFRLSSVNNISPHSIHEYFSQHHSASR